MAGEEASGVEPERDALTPELWAAVGNLRRDSPRGPDDPEPYRGTKHFRPGAKVYVIDAFWGTLDSVTVIGRHRKSQRYIRIHMRPKHVDGLRPRLVYSPAVRVLMVEHFAGWDSLPGKEHAELLCEAVPRWQ